MNSQSPCALAEDFVWFRGPPDMLTSWLSEPAAFTLGSIARSLLAPLPALTVATLGSIARSLLAPLPALTVATLGSPECPPSSRNPSSRR
ncbi:hypothetical protein MINTMi198_06510 [Mycobacterium intracellulare M.i.198]|uniref:Uncharacterized protein n=2 Tax=Mycobacterium avium complex (MAC) TaxID=120793 RepID=A0A7R7MPW7_MYCIT|nr:hypothetical protein MPRI_25340 [Mycobacterium paraintracellulare]BCO44966.1 hypothetical protein MINTM002_06400 [Mycobacterium intracellulare]BCP35281.1 hypothetical protein MINTMi198_06510 [Mycobacterium intracellulare M.i.198]BCO55402.1 hypothetical protein MINTM005_06460 [Mycobacterium intracellulare]BCO60781.1 hypothetical protein MINTM006_07310 [Mycobacterium intracellulare]